MYKRELIRETETGGQIYLVEDTNLNTVFFVARPSKVNIHFERVFNSFSESLIFLQEFYNNDFKTRD